MRFGTLLAAFNCLHPTRPPIRAHISLQQDEMPLVDALVAASKSVRAPFFFPGHKMGGGAPSALRRLGLSRRVLRHDLPELPDLDNLFAPEGAIRRAQELAADAFGAERTWFLANGSTAGVLAGLLACVQLWHQQQRRRHDAAAPVVILPRNAHKSAVHALLMSGAQPCWLAPEVDASSGVCLGVAAAAVHEALERCGPRRVAAVLLVSPTYEGVLSDVASCADACAAAGVPLVVDEAHGAHLTFLPADAHVAGAPHARAALHEGADLAVQSTHKTLGSLTQSAMLHLSARAHSTRPQLATALAAALEVVTSSSPSYLLLASLDAARWQMASSRGDGVRQLRAAASLADKLRTGVSSLTPEGSWLLSLGRRAGVHATDPLRLTVLTPALEGGFALDDTLIAAGVYAELPEANRITFAISAGSTRGHVRRLLRELKRHAATTAADAAAAATSERSPLATELADVYTRCRELQWATTVDGDSATLTPRQAAFCSQRVVSAEAAVGCLSAELVCPYPPGIPILVPGEPVTHDALQLLQAMRAAGCVLTGCSDSELRSLAVLDL